MPSALIFPHTLLRRAMAGGFTPWLEPLYFIEPNSLSQSALPPLFAERGLVRVLRPKADSAERELKKHGQLAEALAKWEQWVATQRGAGRLETVKAGIRPPDSDMETLRGLMADIRAPGIQRPKVGAEAPPPETPPGLLLHLGHIWETQAAEMDDLVSKVLAKSSLLPRVMGRDLEEDQETEFQDVVDMDLTPAEQELTTEKLLVERLRAWAELINGQAVGDASLATANLPAARLMMERANQAVTPEIAEDRSPAGASLISGAPPLRPEPGSALAQEALRIQLPDLSALSVEQMLRTRDALDTGGSLAMVRSLFDEILDSLGEGVWSPGLLDKTAALAGEAGDRARKALEESWHGPMRMVHLSFLVFPGYSREDMLNLMMGRKESDAGGHAGIKGSAVVLAAWPMAV